MPSLAPRRSDPAGNARGIASLIRRLEEVRARLREAEGRVPLTAFGPSENSARNLIHYLALRQFDLRGVQDGLADLGLSSLGRSEGHVLDNLNKVLERLRSLAGRPDGHDEGPGGITPEQGRRVLSSNASHLFGRPPSGRDTRIMVTLPTEAARDSKFVRDLLTGGMDCVRINCAHDTEADWTRMLGHLRTAGRALGKPCRIEMELGGPRLRTGPLEPGAAVLKVRPTRDQSGRVVREARIEIRSPGSSTNLGVFGTPRLIASADWLSRRRVREQLEFLDARGSRRTLRVESRSPGGVVVRADRTSYFTNGMNIDGHSPSGRRDRSVLSGVESAPGRIRLAPGDWLQLRSTAEPGHDRRRGHRSSASVPVIAVVPPGALDRLGPGDRVWFDGGRIGGVARRRSRAGVRVRIDHAPPGGAWLRGDQGINLPDTDLQLPPLTSRDRLDLRFIVSHADLVGYSFVQSAEDVETLREELARLGRPRMGIVLKIETRRAFDQLPAILLSALRSGPAAIMVARGDLAVEVGFERLAEVQEEILWLCEAAHLPAIWATQVLEGLAKTGMPSRAEVTDAAMGERAECVMLNKGPYLVEALHALDSIVRRMQAHQSKKSSRLRHLAVAERFLAAGPVARVRGTGK